MIAPDPRDGEFKYGGLPPGCILVRGRDTHDEWIPSGSTRLKAGDRITAVIAPEAANALALLRHGCEGEAEHED